MSKVFDLIKINNDLRGKSPEEIVEYSIGLFGIEKLTVASSLSIEDQMLSHIILKLNKKARIFVLDTGRHFQSTYDVLDETMRKYGFKYEIYSPDTKELEDLVRNYGPNTFYIDVENRKRCCTIRKTNPLKRALSNVDAWVVGLRKEQGITRSDLDIVEFDQLHNIIKISPLANLSEEDVWAYIKTNKIPYSELYNKGFRSIGCEPCTRAVKEGEDIRAGRWWWENPDSKECGLHLSSSKI